MPELEATIGRLEERTEYIAKRLDDISEKWDKDHDFMIKCGTKLNGHIAEHERNEKSNRWKIGILIGLVPAVISLIVGLLIKYT